MRPVDVQEGNSPLILSIPHAGIEIPESILKRLNPTGQALRDTDWHVDRLYDGLVPRATIVRARFHRYVIDANRDPSGASLYPGQNTTGLVPLIDFDGAPIWHDGEEPDADETAQRIEDFHRPYHEALGAQIDRVLSVHGIAVLYDCHSIRSRIPYLFDGCLPDFNLGTNDGLSCAARFAAAASAVCESAVEYTCVVNGRFKGGWTTRHYGHPENRVHALQMELSQATYLADEAPPFEFSAPRAARLRPYLARLLGRLETMAIESPTVTGRVS